MAVTQFQRFHHDRILLRVEIANAPFLRPGAMDLPGFERLMLLVQERHVDLSGLEIPVLKRIQAPADDVGILEVAAFQGKVRVLRPHRKFVLESILSSFFKGFEVVFDIQATDALKPDVVVVTNTDEFHPEVKSDGRIVSTC